MELAKKCPTFGLYFRRYAAFATSGNPSAPAQRLEGVTRPGPSTALNTSARTYGCVMFNQNGIVDQFAGSNGTSIHLRSWGSVLPGSKISFAVVRSSLAGPSRFEFTAAIKGENPSAPKAIDIETTVTARVDFGHSGRLRISGEALGDNFPNLEVFLVCHRSAHTALLIDGRTDGGRAFGPPLRLTDAHSDHSLGLFSVELPLTSEGELAADSTVTATSLRPYRPR
jgi:hypothetical protein